MLKQTSVRTLAFMLTLILAFFCFSVVSYAADEEIDISTTYESGEISISGTIPSLSGTQASLMIFDPSFSGSNINPTNEAMVAIDQFAVAADGKFSITVKVNNPVSGDYHLYINGESIYKTFVFDGSAQTYILGDVDMDGEVVLKDALLVQKYVAKFITLDDMQMLAANTYYANGDKAINLKDVLTIQKFVAGLLPDDTLVGTVLTV